MNPSPFQVRFETPSGHQAQVDFARFITVLEDEPGMTRNIRLFSMRWAKGNDANALCAPDGERGAWANIPPKSDRGDPICQFRDIATRYNKLAENFRISLKLAWGSVLATR
jgi:hypothetical protein